MTVSGLARDGKPRRTISALLIDLDDTLYRSHEVPQLVRNAIQAYMLNKLGYSPAEVAQATTNLYLQHGTTLAGLVATGHVIDYDDWHRHVHHDALDYKALLTPDPQLRQLLNSISVKKYILTNADREHTRRCLDRLGITDCFEGIFDFEWAQQAAEAHGVVNPEHPITCKPQHGIYSLALQAMHCEPSQVLFFDDSPRNIQGAHELGLVTAIVGRDTLVPGADIALPTMHALPAALPELFLSSPSDASQQHQQHAGAATRQASCQLQEVEHQHQQQQASGEGQEPLAQLVTVAQGSGSSHTR